jgi:hypothetical protein
MAPSIWAALREVAGKKSKLTDDPRPEIRKVRPKAFPTDGTGAPGSYATSPYDYVEVDNLIETDSYARRAVSRMLELFFKEGYSLKGSDPEAVRYIALRFRLLGIAMNQPWSDFLAESAENLIQYHNLFWVKTRNITPQQLTGLPYQGLGGKDPLAGYVLMPVQTVSIMPDQQGRPQKYKQVAGANQAEFPAEDVIQIAIRAKTGTEWGRPDLLTAVEDIISFRIIEQDALNLVHKEMYPTYVYSVGDEMRPAEDADLQTAADRLEDMREVGGLVIPGKDSVDTIGANNTLDVSPHVNHFRERGIVGLGVAPFQIGATSNANLSLSASLDAALYDKVKFYQEKLEAAVNEYIIFELLLEGGFDPLGISGDSQMVSLEFKEINVDAQIKRENHISVLWLQNMITHGQMRTMMGLEVDPNYQDMYHIDMVELVLAESKGASTGPEGGANPQSPAKGSAGSKNNPANKSGNRGGPKVKAFADPLLNLSVEETSVEEMLRHTAHLEKRLKDLQES